MQKALKGRKQAERKRPLSPLQGFEFLLSSYLGLTPQALCFRPFGAEFLSLNPVTTILKPAR